MIQKKLFSSDLELETERIKLRIVSLDDVNELFVQTQESTLWDRYTSDLSKKENLIDWTNHNLNLYQKEIMVPFSILLKKENKLIGNTSYGNISLIDKRLEIGWTWLGQVYHGTGINKHAKFLLLAFAFDELEMERVEFKTDVKNLRSRKAMKKIGAVEEGILRSHTEMARGYRRDTVYFSILKDEWLTLKETIFKDFDH